MGNYPSLLCCQEERTDSRFSYFPIEEWITASNPLWRNRKLADQAMDRINTTLCELYAAEYRPLVTARAATAALVVAGVMQDPI